MGAFWTLLKWYPQVLRFVLIFDSLKPIQRRILYSWIRMANALMTRAIVNLPSQVGNIMGNFHPHGDSSIYMMLWLRCLGLEESGILVEMRGNNGSMDDPPAAIRYAEARLSEIAGYLLPDVIKHRSRFGLGTLMIQRGEPTVYLQPFQTRLMVLQSFCWLYHRPFPPFNPVQKSSILRCLHD